MTTVMAQLIVGALAPIVIGAVLVITWRNRYRAITSLCALSLGLECVNYVVYFLQRARIISFGTNNILLPADVVRTLSSGCAAYVSIAAWALALALAASARQFGWLLGILLAAIVSVASRTLIDYPVVFFQHGYSYGVISVLIVAVNLVTIITLLYGLLGRKSSATSISQEVASAPQSSTLHG